MNALMPFILPFLLGFSTLETLLRHTRIPGRMFLSAVLAIPAGLSLLSLMIFLAHCLHAPSAHSITWVLAAAGLTAAMVIFLKDLPVEYLSKARGASRSVPAPGFWHHDVEKWPDRLFVQALVAGSFLLLIFAAADFLDYYWKNATLNIWGGWDSRFMWHLKARFLYRDPAEWRGMFSPLVSWENQDYPLMLPGILSWGWLWMAQEAPAWPALVSLSFYISLTGLFFWYFTFYHSAGSGALSAFFLLTLPHLRFWAGAFYADLPFAFFCAAATVLLMAALRHKDAVLFILSGLFAGFAVWTKNEGLLFFAALTALALPLWLRQPGPQLKSAAAYFAAALIPLAAFFAVKIFLAGKTTYLFASKSPADYVRLFTDWDKIYFLGAAFLAFKRSAGWQGLWYLFAASLIFYPLMRTQKRRLPYGWLPLALVLMMEAGYGAAYLITPVEIHQHLTTSLTRLLLHSGILALLFIFETFSVPGKRNILPVEKEDAACSVS